MRDCSLRLQALKDRAGGIAMVKSLENVYDFVRASQVKSSDAVMEQEIEMIRLIGELEKIEGTLDKLMGLASERNHILRTNP